MYLDKLVLLSNYLAITCLQVITYQVITNHNFELKYLKAT